MHVDDKRRKMRCICICHSLSLSLPSFIFASSVIDSCNSIRLCFTFQLAGRALCKSQLREHTHSPTLSLSVSPSRSVEQNQHISFPSSPPFQTKQMLISMREGSKRESERNDRGPPPSPSCNCCNAHVVSVISRKPSSKIHTQAQQIYTHTHTNQHRPVVHGLFDHHSFDFLEYLRHGECFIIA